MTSSHERSIVGVKEMNSFEGGNASIPNHRRGGYRILMLRESDVRS